MKKSQHTKGPWEADETSSGWRVLACDPRATIVCRVTGASVNPISKADAHLIAAAPDLLAALRMVLGDVIFSRLEATGNEAAFDLATRRLEIAEAAIAKAEGREP